MFGVTPSEVEGFARPRSFAAALLEPYPEASVASALRRRLLAASILVVVGLGFLRWLGERRGLYDSATGTVIFGSLVLLAVMLLIAYVARVLDRADTRRRRLETGYRRLVEQLPLVIYADEISDNSANIYTSPQVEPLLGYTVEEWVEDADLFVKTLHPEDRERVLETVKRSNAEQTPFACEYRLVAKDGRVVWIHDEATFYRDDDGAVVHSQGYMLDITRRRLAEEELRRLATVDPLTGLPNRARLIERMRATAAAGAPQTLLFLDLDDFKTVNDSLGHRAGDVLLVEIGDRLSDCVRADDLVVRVGGDEFAVLTTVTERPQLEGLARRLLRELAEPLNLDDRELWTHASIGIATGGSEDELLRNADLAMYAAKRRGGNAYAFFATELHEAAQRRLRLLADLRRPEIYDELHLVYQPTFDLRRGGIEGFEALLRWRHPGLGPIPPDEFIPAAEENGTIVEVGRWVLQSACRAAAGWPKGDAPPIAAVNVSGRQLREPAFIDDVRAALRDSGLDPARLRLELTESVLVHANEDARRNVAAVRDLGVQLAIDDFGTGNSWIGHLHEFAPDVIKVDRSFIAALDGGDSPILRGTVALGRELDVRVVAEGIERADQLHAARRLGCDIGQGFLLSRPIPADEAAAMLESGRQVATGHLRLV